MRKPRSLLLSCAACASLFAAGACASNGGVAQAGNGGAPQVRRDPNVITQEELEQSGETNTRSAIARLRPAFLSARGVSTVMANDPGVMVYLDGTRYGDLSTLDNLPIQDIKRIQFLNAGEATQRFGTGNSHGVILITRK